MRMLIYDNNLNGFQAPTDQERQEVQIGDCVEVIVGDHGGRFMQGHWLKILEEMNKFGYYQGEWANGRPLYYPEGLLPRIEVHYMNIKQIDKGGKFVAKQSSDTEGE